MFNVNIIETSESLSNRADSVHKIHTYILAHILNFDLSLYLFCSSLSLCVCGFLLRYFPKIEDTNILQRLTLLGLHVGLYCGFNVVLPGEIF